MTIPGRFALIPLPENEPPPANAIAWGDMAAVTQPILSANARDDAIELLNFTRDSVGELQRLADGLAHHKAEHAYQVISGLCDGIAKMAARMDAYVRREDERQRQGRAEARKAIEDSLPDPDDPTGDYPAPSLQPNLREEDPGQYPDEDELTYDTPAELPEDAPRSDDHVSGDLPSKVALPAPLGSYPAWNIKDLKHPQEQPPTPTAIGGP